MAQRRIINSSARLLFSVQTLNHIMRVLFNYLEYVIVVIQLN